MARSHARLSCSIWQDGDYTELSMGAQWMYEALVSQPNINNAGVVAFTPRRWANLSRDVSVSDVLEFLAELEAARFIVVDEDAGEILVRSFIRHDGVSSNGKVFKNALDVARQVHSAALRQVLADELRRVGSETALAAAEEIEPQVTQPIKTSTKKVEKNRTDVEGPQESQGVGVGVGSVGNSPNVGGYVSAPSQAKSRRTRATRIPDDFTVTPEMRAWAANKTPGVDIDFETEQFVDFWRAKSGKDATKVDWVGTWRNWMRNAFKRLPQWKRGVAVPSADPVEWLRKRWETGDIRDIVDLTGIAYEQPNLPDDVTSSEEIKRFNLDARRKWIEAHRDAILAKLSERKVA